ncbi:MAG: hypothetical protein EOP34_07455 [Rickettsiales bacterium]|nr:MAG: hypothetical protein EOP34_07455 [Rickettsiales bacterium]
MLASTYLIFFSPESNREVTGSIIDKSVHGFIPFSYAPYFIPFKKLFSKRNENTKGSGIMIVGYTILLFIISIAQNNRTSFMLGFTSIGFTYGLGLLIGSFRPYLFSFKNIMFILIGFWLITGPIADLGTAMVIVRGDRNDIKASELIMRTLEKFQDKRAIERRRNEDRIQQEEWDERYLNNIIIARFANLKFNDISLIQELKIGDKNIDMYNYSINYIWGALPDPFLKFLNINVNKEFIYSISFGDYLYYLANSDSEVSVGYRLGHFSGTGMAAFGWWYLLILGVGIIPIFLLFDLFVIKAKIKAWNGQVIVSDLKFSLCGLLSLTSIFLFLPSESVVAVIIFLIRGWLQLVILYLVVFYFTNFAYKIMNAFTLKLNHNN